MATSPSPLLNLPTAPSHSHRPPLGRLALALIAALPLAACESGGRSLSPEERAAATPAQHDEYGKLGYRVEWRGFPVLSRGASIARMEILGDLVSVQDSGAELTVLETRSGERRWSDPVANPLTRFVGLNRDGKRLIVSSESQAYFYDVDTGSLLTKQNLAQVVNTRPVQVAEILVYGATSGQVLGHLMLNGFRQWGSFASGPIETDPVPLGDSGTVGLVSRDGDVLILDGLSGSLRGRNKIFGGSTAPIGSSGEAMFIASTDHSLYAFSADQARMLWRVRSEAPLVNGPVHHEGRVYVDMGESGFSAFDAKDGSLAWANRDVHGTLVAVRGGRLLVWDGRTAALLDPARGGVVEKAELKGISLIRPDRFVDGNLYLASSAGVVTKLATKK